MNFFDWLKSIFSPKPPAPVAATKGAYRSDWPASSWDGYTIQALRELATDLLLAHPRDAKEWVSGSTYDPVQLYLMLLSALAHYESSYKTGATYTENFKDAHGKLVVSRGLLQISQESANGYGAGISDPMHLHDAQTNIRAGVRIMRKLILQDGVISGGTPGAWKGMARYWSPFRKPECLLYMRARTKAVN